jgi:radical SAM protein with 4Fe4S-binding SPASM domain
VTARPKVYALAVELTSACNQKCSYCYNGWREDDGKGVGALPTAELCALLERALDEVEFDHVTLTGGEPLSRRDLFDVLDLLKRKQTRFQMISNGGLVTEAIATRLATYEPLSVQVTLDGPSAEHHDPLVSGDSGVVGHFERTLRGIRHLRAAGITVVGCMVVNRKNAHLVGETLALFASLGVRDISFSRFSPAGYSASFAAELLPSRSDIVGALDAAEASAIAHGLRIQSTMPIPPCVIEHDDYPNVRFGGCPIGTEMQELALGPRGELRNCTLYETPIGDARATSFAVLAESAVRTRYRDVTPEFCAPCPHRSSCLGGCGAASVALTGERGLDPFVAQHVDDALAARLSAARAGGHFVPANRLVRTGA